MTTHVLRSARFASTTIFSSSSLHCNNSWNRSFGFTTTADCLCRNFRYPARLKWCLCRLQLPQLIKCAFNDHWHCFACTFLLEFALYGGQCGCFLFYNTRFSQPLAYNNHSVQPHICQTFGVLWLFQNWFNEIRSFECNENFSASVKMSLSPSHLECGALIQPRCRD